LYFDIKKTKTNNSILLYYSSLEKTLLDMIYLKKDIDLNEYKFNKFIFLKKSSRYNRIVKKRIKEMI